MILSILYLILSVILFISIHLILTIPHLNGLSSFLDVGFYKEKPAENSPANKRVHYNLVVNFNNKPVFSAEYFGANDDNYQFIIEDVCPSTYITIHTLPNFTVEDSHEEVFDYVTLYFTEGKLELRQVDSNDRVLNSKEVMIPCNYDPNLLSHE